MSRNTAVIGGGLMGLALAWRLSQRGIAVDVYESDEQLGGLATHHDFGGFNWDRFYHVILPSDRHLIRFIGDLGLGDELKWQTTRTGFYVDDKMHSVSNSMEFLKFPLLNLVDKFRLALTMIYSSRIDDWQSLETVSVEDWLKKVSGKRTYEKMWKPLLLAKLGDHYRDASAVFIWSYIKRLFSARDSSASKESLGHVAGGYKQVFDALRRGIEANGGRVMVGTPVESIREAEGGLLRVKLDGSRSAVYRDVVCTSPVPILRRLAGSSLLETEREGEDVKYLGVVCPVLVSSAPVSPFYVVNIADESIPFTGVIGMSTVVDPGFTGDKYLTYLPKYVASNDALFDEPSDSIRERFVPHLEKMFPEFDLGCIESVHVNRARRVQPLQVKNFSSIVPQVRTTHPHFYALNTAQFVNGTLNNNEVVRAVDEFVAEYGDRFEELREAA